MAKKKQFIIDDLNQDNQKFEDLLNLQSNSKDVQVKKNIVIDKDLQAFIPPLTTEEFDQLESNILAEGIRDALIAWQNPKQKSKYTLIDGHNRYAIAQKHQLDFAVKIMEFDSIAEVQNWMIANQLGKRNLTEVQKAYLRGKQYQQEKKAIGANQYQSGVDILTTPPEESGVDILTTPLKTHEKIAQQHKVSPKTIQRDEKYAQQIDALVAEDHELKWKILNKEIDLPKSALPIIAEQNPALLQQIRTELKEGKPVKTLLQEIQNQASEENETDDTLQSVKKEVIKNIQKAFKNKDKKLIDEIIEELKNLKNRL